MGESVSVRLGNQLRRLREERKLTLGGVEDLSESLGERIAKSYLFRVERGKTYPSLPRLRILAKVYSVRLSFLVDMLEGAMEETERGSDLGIDFARFSFEDLRERGIDSERSGDFTRAAAFYRAAWDRALLEKTESSQGVRVATARHDLAIALRNAGRLELAREQAEAALEATALPQDLRDRIRLNLATIYRRQQRPVITADLIDGILARAESVSSEILAGAHQTMAAVLLAAHPKEAAKHYLSALKIERRERNHFECCKLLYGTSLAETKQGNFQRALRRLHEAREMARRHQFAFWSSMVETELGKVHYLRGELAEARRALREANLLARQGDYAYQLFMNHFYLRRLALDEKDEKGARAAEASLRFFARRLEDTFEELEAFKEERQ